MRWPYAAVEFTTRGEVADRGRLTAVRELVSDTGATDVLVVAHGWNNDIPAAERLYTRLCDNAAELAAARGTGRRTAVVGVLWPSLRWTGDARVAGGGLSAAGELPGLLDAIDERVPDPAVAAELRALAGELGRPASREQFVQLLRTLLPDPASTADDDPVPPTLTDGDPETVFARAGEAEQALAAESRLVSPPAAGDLPPGVAPDLLPGGDTVGAGFSFADLDPARLARRLLDTSTYYTMKARAGDVGTRGVAELLTLLAGTAPGPRLHLAGHSFGARVVTAAAAGTDEEVSSVTLLQGAFSHHGLSGSTTPPGAFRRLLDGGRLRGPVVVTHTHNDKALLVAYAVASRLARQVSSGFGGADDPYGGIGANGAVATAEVDAGVLGDERTRYTLRPGRVANLLADAGISGHGDVSNPAVANVLLQALLAREAAAPAEQLTPH